MSNFRERSDKMIYLFKCVLAILYIVMGIVIFFIKDNAAFASYPESVKIAFVILCIAYGAFRFYRAISLDNKEEE
jgi:hypothetical protein